MKSRLPGSIYLLSIGIFLMVCCELQVLGMTQQLTRDFDISVAKVGYLVSAFAAAMALGGPVLTLMFNRLPPKTFVIRLYVVFVFGEVLGAVTHQYWLLMLSRLITGAVAGAFFGVAISMCQQLTDKSRQLDAVALVLSGIMLGTIIGLPVAKVMAEWFTWSASFYLLALLALVFALLSAISLPRIQPEPAKAVKDEIAALNNARLGWLYATSFFVISAAYAPFSYIVPILSAHAALPQNTITLLLLAYGIVMLAGNQIVAKLAVHHAKTVIMAGLSLVGAALAVFYLFGSNPYIAGAATLTIGLCGVSLNPALVARIMQLPQGQRTFTHTVHSSVITLGIMFGSFIAALGLDAGFSLVSPLLVGLFFALIAMLIVLFTPPLLTKSVLPIPPA
ncbi:MFS transporter [Oceanimonas baumannii]|uniref:MFS family arabinose efflux permease n=3 Tax=Oceanimonas baumannii TaxID=129578 RepID=A0A235CHQ3_9GAMM|nr:MFS transporter [Oceanimonas baumannii]TDW58764.1 putative MFS family arabinose efflux permease [Oceanimonas baumannii]